MCSPVLTSDWLTAIGTIAASVVALFVALVGERITHFWFHPSLKLDATVRRPDSEKARRWATIGEGKVIDLGFAYFFRLAITNRGKAAARDVQVIVAKVEQVAGEKVTKIDRFTPMNLKWSYTGKATREVLLAGDLPPVFCDFIHIGEPISRVPSGEDLHNVPSEHAVICLDIEAATSNKGNLLEPGTYRFDVKLVAENQRVQSHAVEVEFPGKFFSKQEDMFDKGFKMKKI